MPPVEVMPCATTNMTVTVIRPVEEKPERATLSGTIWQAAMMDSMPSMMKSGPCSAQGGRAGQWEGHHAAGGGGGCTDTS